MLECKHGHILDIARVLLISSKCPECFLGEAIRTTVYAINHIPIPTISNISPYMWVYVLHPIIRYYFVFGYTCFVQHQPHENNRLERRAYLCWDAISKRLQVSRHATFWEHKMFSSLSDDPILCVPLVQEFRSSQSNSIPLKRSIALWE